MVIFFRAPLQGSKILRAPFFASGPPLQVFVNGPLVAAGHPLLPSKVLKLAVCQSGTALIDLYVAGQEESAHVHVSVYRA